MKIILLIGKICVGKTTYAKTLGGMLISCDQLMQTLFPGGCGEHHDLLAERARNYLLDLGYVGEMVELWINGQSAGVRFGPPYRFEIGEFLVPGENKIVADVANHYGFEKKDVFSKFVMYEPSGMMGPVALKKYHFAEE